MREGNDGERCVRGWELGGDLSLDCVLRVGKEKTLRSTHSEVIRRPCITQTTHPLSQSITVHLILQSETFGTARNRILIRYHTHIFFMPTNKNTAIAHNPKSIIKRESTVG